MKNVTFRAARLEDGAGMFAVHLAAIHAIEDQFYDQASRESWAFGLMPQGYGRSMAEGEIFELALDSASEIIGFCGMKNGEIFGLYVHPEAQGRGLGKALLQRAEKRLAIKGRYVAPLTASLNAKAFYEANGWQFVERREHKSRGGLIQPVAAMQKTIGSEG
jgi:ribosomal protein S18 acetylase RimI-like enzyme